MKRIVLLFDGTWNEPDDDTNVRRCYRLLKGSELSGKVQIKQLQAQSSDKPSQIAYYYSGVGTNWMKFTGGAFGNGLSENVLAGYEDLCKVYEPGDQIFLLGFSRGAYTARSLAGLIRKCGVLIAPDDALIQQAYQLYKSRDPALHPDAREPSGFRDAFAHADPQIEFIGVWDTVGALGIPTSNTWFPGSRGKYQFHDVELSGIVRKAYHAVAIDEHREDYQPTMWARIAKGDDPAVKQVVKDNQTIEQRWFIGAHSNVGGGYRNDPLSSIPLHWLCQKAQECGLVFESVPLPQPQAHLAPITDSYAKFMKGIYKLFKRGRRYARIHGAGISESIDESVWRRWAAIPDYRPRSLVRAARSRPPEN